MLDFLTEGENDVAGRQVAQLFSGYLYTPIAVAIVELGPGGFWDYLGSHPGEAVKFACAMGYHLPAARCPGRRGLPATGRRAGRGRRRQPGHDAGLGYELRRDFPVGAVNGAQPPLRVLEFERT